MYFKKAFLGLMVILLPLLSLSKQQNSLNVGDTIPSALLQHIHTLAGTKSSKLQLYILTFFSYTCGASLQCVKHNTVLEQKFANTVSFIALTKENIQPVGTSKSLPHIAADTLLSHSFFYELVPHIVWINALGVVRAITAAEQLTEQNIRAVLADARFTMPVKADKHYDNTKTLLQNLGLQQTVIASYSYYSNELPGVPGMRKRIKDTATHQTTITALNNTIPGLYALAYKKWLFLPCQFITDSTIPNTVNCYELLTNTLSDSIVTATMLHDLNRFFHTTSTLLKKEISWYRLTAIAKNTTPPATNTITTSELLTALNNAGLPFIEDGTGSNHGIPASLLAALATNTNISIPYVNQLIRPYDLCITTITQIKEVLVVQKQSF